MNKQNGLLICPYKHAHRNRDKDKELLYLKRYLTKVGKLESLSHLNHSKWQAYLHDDWEQSGQ